VMAVQLELIQACSSELAQILQRVATQHGYRPVQDPQAGVVIVSSDSNHDSLLRARQQIERLKKNGVPVFAISLDQLGQLPSMASTIPHDGEWIEAESHDVAAIEAALEEAERRADAATSQALDKVSDRLHSKLRSFKPRKSVLARTPVETSGVSVFVSYSRYDKLASDVVAQLQRHGHDVWIDTSSIAGGSDWRASIEQGIKKTSVFILLMSPKVLANPDFVRQELQYATSMRRPIIPVYLRRTPNLPDGLNLPLAGTHWLSLQPNFEQGIASLLEVIGESEVSGAKTLRDQVGSFTATVRRVAHEQEFGKRARNYAGAALAGGAVVGAAALKILVAQHEAAQQARQMEEIRSRTEYRDRTLRLLKQAQRELGRVDFESLAGMDARAFREEFAPRFQKTIGALTAIKPTDPDLRDKHERLVETLEEVAGDFGRAYQAIENSDRAAYLRTINKIQASAAEVFEANIAWIVEVID
jgi:hypothetical protein